MALRPGDRYPSPRALADEIEKWLADEPVGAMQDSIMERAAHWRDGIELWFRATAAAVLAIAAVAIVAALLIERQRRLAESLAIERDAAHVQAETGFRKAQHAVDDLFTRVSEDTLLNQPGTQQLRKELLEKTLTYYKRFIRQALERSGISKQTWGNVFPQGQIVKDLQSPGEALEYYDRRAKAAAEPACQDTFRPQIDLNLSRIH